MGGYETDGIDDGDALLVGFDDGMLDIVGPIVGSGEGEELGSFVVETNYWCHRYSRINSCGIAWDIVSLLLSTN